MPLLENYPTWIDYFGDKGFFKTEGDSGINAQLASQYIERHLPNIRTDNYKNAFETYIKQISIKYPECGV